ncbi:death domain-containing protein CRADD isoform X1 [Lampris incognitus]|uniref:death domain-containing protein CRADD isoform X1 n=1 Tax=Lampris incognitus TaxID=2546036 RepID=UPI0024B5B7C5|nr:death domain-containing protein CRADD isoform X1 [Lampris incognitus]
MDAAHRDLLRRRRLDLASQVLASDTVVQVLYQEGVLTESQFEDIESQATNRKKMLRLLDILPARGPRAFGAFLRSLEEFSWVRAALLRELESGAAAAPHGPQGCSAASHISRTRTPPGPRGRQGRLLPTPSTLDTTFLRLCPLERGRGPSGPKPDATRIVFPLLQLD